MIIRKEFPGREIQLSGDASEAGGPQIGKVAGEGTLEEEMAFCTCGRWCATGAVSLRIIGAYWD